MSTRDRLQKWKDDKCKVYVYTTTVRLHGVLTSFDADGIELDGKTILPYNNIVSISISVGD